MLFLHFDSWQIHLSTRNSSVMLVSRADKGLSSALSLEKERSLK
jgi:hypothetical protein